MKTLLFLLISILVTNSAFSEVLRKRGNNGSVTCRAFCAGPAWGEFGGSCLRGFDHDRGISLGCDDSASSSNLSCICVKGNLKGGNNGTVSCTDWCSRDGTNGPGPQMNCVGAKRSDNNVNVACEETPGFLNGAQHDCWCQNSIASSMSQLQEKLNNANSDLEGKRAIENSLAARSDQLNAQVASLNAQISLINGELLAKQNSFQETTSKVETLGSQLSQVTAANQATQQKLSEEQKNLEAISAMRAELSKTHQDLAAKNQEKTTEKMSLEAQASSLLTEHSNLTKHLEEHLKPKLELVPDIVKVLSNQVGKLELGDRVCSATLIGPKTIRTAAHCLSHENFGIFILANKAYNIETVLYKNAMSDSAILNLAEENPNFLNLTATPSVGKSANLLAWNTVTASLTLSPSCQILGYDILSGVIRHNCDSRAGMSGGVLIQNGFIVGIHIGRNSKTKIAMKISTANLFPWNKEDLEGLEFEYNCSSDCNREATRKIFGNKIFDPATFTACTAARNADCAARTVAEEAARIERAAREETERSAMATKEDLIRLRNNLNSEINHASNSIADQFEALEHVSANLEHQIRKVTHLQDMVSTVENTYNMVENQFNTSKNDLTNLTHAVGDQFQKLYTIEKMLADGEKALIRSKDELERISRQKLTTSGLVNQLQKDIIPLTANIKVLEEEIQSTKGVIKQTQESLGLLKNQVEDGTNLTLISRGFYESFGQISGITVELKQDLNATFKNLVESKSHLFSNISINHQELIERLKERSKLDEAWVMMRDLIADEWWVKGRGKFQAIFGYTPPSENRKVHLIKRLEDVKRERYCLKITRERFRDYKQTLEELQVASFPSKTNELTYSQVIAASMRIQAEINKFAELSGILKVNNCLQEDILKSLDKAAVDSMEWNLWLLRARTEISMKIGA